MKFTRTVVAISGLMAAAAAQADQGIFDVRSAYMGGTGVAGQRADAGIPLNPANLALPTDSEHFGLTVPVVGAVLNDPDNLRGQVNTVQNTDIDQITADINTLQQAPSLELSVPGGPYSGQMSNLGNVAGQLENTLKGDNGSQILVNGGVGLGLAVPGKNLGVGVDAKGSASFVGTPQISGPDLELLQQMNAVFSKGYVTEADRLQYPQLFSGSSLSPSNYHSTSSAHLVGLEQVEEGVSFAHQFALAGNDQALAVGITPKILQLKTYDYNQLLNSANGFNTSDLKNFARTDSMFNVDAGLTWQANANWRAAAVVNNVISKSLTTVSGNHVDLDPKVTTGLTYNSKFFTWSLDADLTKQTDVGFNTDSQIVATGVEFNAWNYIRLGLGYRHNLVSSAQRDLGTAGISTSLLGLNVGLALQANRHETAGAVQVSLEY